MPPSKNNPRPLPGTAEAAAAAADPLNAMGSAAPAPLPPPAPGFGGHTFEPSVDVDSEGGAPEMPPPGSHLGEIGAGRVRMPMPEPSAGTVSADPEIKGETDAEIEAEIRARWGVGAENKRIPFGAGNKRLPDAKRRGFHRHVFNDVPGRIAQALRAGYKHVEDESGGHISSVVGTSPLGGPLHGYLMEIPEQWFHADMARNASQVDEVDEAIRGGSIGAKEGDGRYGSGIKIERVDD